MHVVPTVSEHERHFRALSQRQGNIAAVLTAVMIIVYFGFILLIAYNRPLMARLIVPGLSVGILLGALVIVCTWLLTWVYVRWANTHYDAEIDRLRR